MASWPENERMASYPSPPTDPPALLAIDLGVRVGLACYGGDGRLVWYRSHNFGSMGRLKRGVSGVLDGVPGLAWIVTEGDRHQAEVWADAAKRRGASARTVTPETWREALLHLRERRSGADAKHHADRLARAVIAWSGARAPTSLRHDAAEAILIGLWGVMAAGWLPGLPDGLR